MAILSFRKDSISRLIESEGYEDENGDWHEGECRWDDELPCDAEPSGEAATRTFDDGVTKAYSYTVHLNPDCGEYSIGDRVLLRLKCGIIREL